MEIYFSRNVFIFVISSTNYKNNSKVVPLTNRKISYICNNHKIRNL